MIDFSYPSVTWTGRAFPGRGRTGGGLEKPSRTHEKGPPLNAKAEMAKHLGNTASWPLTDGFRGFRGMKIRRQSRKRQDSRAQSVKKKLPLIGV
jgi:hypothetical protein